jgi:hypothetical protein
VCDGDDGRLRAHRQTEQLVAKVQHMQSALEAADTQLEVQIAHEAATVEERTRQITQQLAVKEAAEAALAATLDVCVMPCPPRLRRSGVCNGAGWPLSSTTAMHWN